MRPYDHKSEHIQVNFDLYHVDLELAIILSSNQDTVWLYVHLNERKGIFLGYVFIINVQG